MKRLLLPSAALAGLASLLFIAGCGGSLGGSSGGTNPAQDVIAVTIAGQLVRLDNDTFATATSQNLTGMAVGETVNAMDFRPATGTLYILGSTGQLYTVDTSTAIATPIGVANPFTGSTFGMDFNPAVDRIRIISNDGENVRLNPDTGAVAAVDTDLSPAGNYVACAYTPGGPGDSVTLFALEANAEQLGTIGGRDGSPSPNSGVFQSIDDLSVTLSSETNFDIDSNGRGYFSTFDGSVTRFYQVNLDNGSVDEVGSTNLRLSGMTVIP